MAPPFVKVTKVLQVADTKEREARAALESRRLMDQHSFAVQKEAAKADSQLRKQQAAIRECMVRVLQKIMFTRKPSY